MKVCTNVILLLLMQASCLNLSAQLNIQQFGVAQGLAQTQVSAMQEDRFGYLWIGTLGGGLSRYDGHTFTNYTMAEGLPNNMIRDLLWTDDQLWVATHSGISRYNGQQFTNYQVGKKIGLFARRIFNHQDSTFYALNNGELGMILKDSIHEPFQHAIIGKVLKTIHIRGTSLIWQTRQGDNSLIIIDKKGLYSIKPDGRFTNLFSAFYQGDDLFVSTNGGLYRVNNTTLDKILDVPHNVIGFDKINQAYIGLDGFVLFTIKSESDRIVERKVNYLVGAQIIDSEGNFWLGTDRGLVKIYPYLFQKILDDPDRDDPVTAIQRYQNQLWIGTTYQGIKIYENNHLTKKYDFGSRTKNYVCTILPDNNGKLYIGTAGGLASYHEGQLIWKSSALINSAGCGAFDKANNAYFGSTERGLYHMNDRGDVNTIEAFKTTVVWSIAYNKWNDFFVIGTNVGLWKIQGDRTEKIERPELEGVELMNMDWMDQNTIIIGTLGKGIFLYSFTNDSLERIDIARGLASNSIFFVFKEDSGIWLGSERGIDFLHLTDGKVSGLTHFDEKDGLLGLETNQGAYHKSGNILNFGLADGLYSFKGQWKEPSTAPLHISSVKLFYGTPTDKSFTPIIESNYSQEEHSFAHNENHLTFDFNKINKRDPDQYFFSYFLEGHDQIWSVPSQVKRVTYSNLFPGTYKLNLVATDRSGTFRHDQTQFNFVIHPPIYQTTWFKVSAVFLIIALFILLAYLYNLSRLRAATHLQEIKDSEQAKLRKEIARDFHDELGNQMARLINYIGLLRIRNVLEQNTYEKLHGFSHQILTGTKDFVWALDPNNDELNNLVLHLKDFGERMFQEKDINFGFYGDLPPSHKLPLGHSRQINLIFKEAMTNTFRHANATRVSFYLRLSPSELHLSLEDNGTGISPDTWEKAVRGINNMKTRAGRLGAQLTMTTTDNGTTITLKLPVNNGQTETSLK